MSGERDPGTSDAIGGEALTAPAGGAVAVPADPAPATPAPAPPAPATPSPTVAAPATPAPATPAPATPASATATDVAATTPAIRPARRRVLAVVALVGRVAQFALVVAILVAGIALGYQAFLSSQPAPSGPVVDPATAGNQAAPVVREFIAAVGNNDADAIRSTLQAGPYKSFTSEMERWEFQEVTSVDTLATFEDGPRTATAFVMVGRTNGGNPIAINLVVETQDGSIMSFK